MSDDTTPTGETAGAARLELKPWDDERIIAVVEAITNDLILIKNSRFSVNRNITHVLVRMRDEWITATAQHEQLQQRVAALERQIDEVIGRNDELTTERDALAANLERARTYVGVEAHACPLCRYEDGKFIAPCAMHRQMDVLAAENERLRSGSYQPVPDGEYMLDDPNGPIRIEGNGDKEACPAIWDDDYPVLLEPGMAVCQWQPAQEREVWEPLPDGQYTLNEPGPMYDGCFLAVCRDGSELHINDDGDYAEAILNDDMRMYRRTAAAQQQGWQPVNPVGMVNGEYDDAEIKLCYRRTTPAQDTQPGDGQE